MKKVLAVVTALMLTSFAYILAVRAETLDEQQEALMVWNSEGETVGTITNALIDSSGNIGFVIVSIGKKEIAVPAESFSKSSEGKLLLDAGKEKLDAAPEFKDSDLSNPNFAGGVYQFFGLVPSWAE